MPRLFNSEGAVLGRRLDSTWVTRNLLLTGASSLGAGIALAILYTVNTAPPEVLLDATAVVLLITWRSVALGASMWLSAETILWLQIFAGLGERQRRIVRHGSVGLGVTGWIAATMLGGLWLGEWGPHSIDWPRLTIKVLIIGVCTLWMFLGLGTFAGAIALGPGTEGARHPERSIRR